MDNFNNIEMGIIIPNFSNIPIAEVVSPENNCSSCYNEFKNYLYQGYNTFKTVVSKKCIIICIIIVIVIMGTIYEMVRGLT